MAKSYRADQRDQPFLLPPDMRDWLPADSGVVLAGDGGGVGYQRLSRARRLGGAGTAGYDPDMMLALLVYAYCQGVH